jgi:hypothetical protein
LGSNQMAFSFVTPVLKPSAILISRFYDFEIPIFYPFFKFPLPKRSLTFFEFDLYPITVFLAIYELSEVKWRFKVPYHSSIAGSLRWLFFSVKNAIFISFDYRS